MSPQGALDIVNSLVDSGLVVAERVGPALLVSLNRDHLAVDPLVALVRLRGRLIELLTGELCAWPGLAGAWLFGSAARGDGDRDSDVDLLLVANETVEDPGWVEKTAELRDHVRRWTGNDVQLVEHDRSSFARLVKTKNRLITAIRSDGVSLTPGSPALLREAA
jgi:predicted nucleotidyltransferase